MFPHNFDRYRMMGYIVRQLRQAKNLTQLQLGQLVEGRRRATGSVSSTLQRRISQIENFKHLAQVAKHGHSPVARDVFVRIASALGLSQVDTDTLLWLIEYNKFRPLQREELNAYISFASMAPREYSDARLRTNALSLLEQAVKRGRFPIRTEVQIYTGWEEEHQVGFRRQLHSMEEQPGQRLLISKYPSNLLYEGSVLDYIDPAENKLSEAARKETVRLTNSRKRIFKEVVRNYGERCIHSEESIRRYLDGKFVHPLPWEERRAHVANLIKTLREFKLFEVALASAEPEMEFVVKSGQLASLRGTARDVNRRDSVICGPLYIFWDNFTAVYSFMVDFELAWNKIPPDQRDKEKVVSKLNSLLARSSRQQVKGRRVSNRPGPR